MRKIFCFLFLLSSLLAAAQPKPDSLIKVSQMQLLLGNGDSAFVPVSIKVGSVLSSRKMYGIDLAKSKVDSLVVSGDSIYYYTSGGAKKFAGKVKPDSVAQLNNVAVDKTYQQLVNDISTSKLAAGKMYRITDFKSVYTILGTTVIDSGSTEPLLVMATSPTTLAVEAHSAAYPKDVIYYSVTDNTPLAPSSGSKGVILFRHDTKENLSSYYDWRTIKWRRWALASGGIYFAFNSNFPSVSSSDYIDQLTFGTSCKNVSIGEYSYNITLGSSNQEITIGKYCGGPGTGIVTSSSVYGIRIADHVATVLTTGSGYIGGIYIGSNSRYINIGTRSYNISIGSGCYALEIGLQNSDIAIPDNTWRRRIEKGFSNFEATVDITNSTTIDLYNSRVYSLGTILYSPANYCGTIKLTTSSTHESIESINAQFNSLSFHDYRFIPADGTSIAFVDKANATISAKNLVLNDNYTIDGSKSHFIQLHKNLVDSAIANGIQRKDFYLSYTNAVSAGNIAFDGTRAITRQTPGMEGVVLGTTTLLATLEKLLYPAQPPTAALTITYSGTTSSTIFLEQMSSGADLTVQLNWTAGRQSSTAPLAIIEVAGAGQSFSQPAGSSSVSGNIPGTVPRNALKNFNLAVTTTDGQTTYSNASVNFLWRRYFGFVSSTSPVDATILALPKEFMNDRLRSATTPQNPTGSQYFCIAFPASYDPGNISQIWIGGLDQTSAFTRTTRSLTNASGGTTSYVIYVSNNPTNGAVSFEIK